MPTPSQLGRTGPLPRTAWTDRVRVLADSSRLPVAGLAELVEAELGRVAGVLFTATPAEDLDEISRWGRLADAAWCGQVRAVVAAHNRMSASEREFLSCEVALALNLSPGAASDLVGTALLAADAPGLLEAVEAGLLTVRHVHAVLGALQGAGLSTEEQHAVVTIALVRYDRHTPAELGKLVRTLVLQVHPAASAAKEQDATYRRRVTFRAVQDGQGLLVARGPLAVIEAIRAALEARVRAAGATGADPGTDPGDDRTRDAVAFDLLAEVLTSTSSADSTGTGGGGGPLAGWTPTIVIPYSTAAGGELELAEIPGLGPVLPDTARQVLAGACQVRRVAVASDGTVLEVSDLLPGPAASATDTDRDNDPNRWLRQLGQLPIRVGIPRGTSSYQPGDRLRRHVQARYRTCTFPGCTRPSRDTDLDHLVPWPLGPTSPDNLHPLCRHHHRAKQSIFTVVRLPDGTTRWITRGGWWFDHPPPNP